MINEFIFMNGYGIYVWSSFLFMFVSFIGLYYQIKSKLTKEQEKFKAKYFDLTKQEIEAVNKQATFREILAFTNITKI